MMTNNQSEQILSDKIAELPKELSPQRDLWPGIERAIDLQQQQPLKNKSFTPIAWAASVVAAVLLTWGVVPKSNVLPHDQLTIIGQMQSSFEQQKQVILASYGSENESTISLSPAMKKELEQLASARQSIEKALENDTENGDLLNLLRWTQKQELDLLKQLYSPQWQTI